MAAAAAAAVVVRVVVGAEAVPREVEGVEAAVTDLGVKVEEAAVAAAGVVWRAAAEARMEPTTAPEARAAVASEVMAATEMGSEVAIAG